MENLPVEEDDIIIKCNLAEMTKAFFKDYEIIWHDPNVNSQENQEYLIQLEKLCRVKTFTEWRQADDYIKSAKTVCNVITSGTNGELLVKEIFSSANVPKIFTFCRAKDYHSIWTQNYEKVLCTETKIEDVISQIQTNLLEWQQKTSSLKFDLPAFAPIFDDRDKSQMNHLHLYLKVIPGFNNRAKAKEDFIALSRGVYLDQKNEKFIANFEQNYTDYKMEETLRWYTQPSFLFKVINNCLRIATSDSIQWSRFFLKDLERAIKDQYHQKSKEFSGLLYRAAYLSEKEWSSLKENVNKEIEMHGFLSVSKDKSAALKFMGVDPAQKVFITIIVPKSPIEEEQGFGEVEEFSKFPKEKEVLFNVRSRFTVLETEDEYSKDMPSRHLVLLYGAQGLRKYLAKENPTQQVSVEDIDNILCSRCQLPIHGELLFLSVVDFEQRTYSCQKCLGDDDTAPFLCVPVTEKGLKTEIKGCLLMNSSQTKIPMYGYQCSKCGVKNQERYFVCTDCGEREKRWCQSCFDKTLSCMEKKHAIILENYPFSFWSEKMQVNELKHSEFQNDLVSSSDPVFRQADMYFETHEYDKAIEYCLRYIDQNEAKGKDDKLGTACQILGGVYDNQGEYGKALDYHLKSLEIKQSVYGENHPELATPYGNIGLVYENQGDFKKALEYHLKSLDISKTLYGEESISVAASYGSIGVIYESQGDYKNALEYNLRSLEVYKLINGEDHPSVATAYNNIALVFGSQGDYEKALDYHFKSLQIEKLLFGENHPSVATSYGNIGSEFENLGEYQKALEYYLKSLNILKSIYGEKHPEVGISYGNIGTVYESQGEFEKALEYHLKSRDIKQSACGENHPSVATAYNNIGSLYDRQGEYKKALEYYLKSLSILKSVYGENHPEVAASYGNIGAVYEGQGESQKALEYNLKSLEVYKLIHGENHPSIADCYGNIGFVYESLGDNKKAFDYHLKSLEMKRSVYGENHPSVAITYGNIGSVYFNQGEYKKALEYYLKSLDILKSVYGENHPDIGNSYNNLGSVYTKLKEHSNALEYHLKSFELHRSIYGENHFSVAISSGNIGAVYESLGDYKKALDYYLKSLEIKQLFYKKTHPSFANSYRNIGSVYFKQGEYQKALEYHLKSLDILKSVHGEKHPSVATSYNNIGEAFENQGEGKKALQYYLKSLDISKSLYGEEHPQTTSIQNKVRQLAPIDQNNQQNL